MIDTASLRINIIDLATSGKLSTHVVNDGSVKEIANNLPLPSKKRKRMMEEQFDYDEQFEIPDHWQWFKLGEISSYGDTPQKVMALDAKPDTWILELEDVESGGKLLKKSRIKDKKSVGEKISFYSGQVLYSKLRPYLKKVLVADEDGISTPEIISFDVYSGINPSYIVYCLTNSYVDKAINKRSYGIKMPRVDAAFMANLPIPIPPVEEQNRIVKTVSDAMNAIDAIDALQLKYSADLNVLKSKIIDAGIQGKLTEQLPEDGNAEELFEQIQVEKAELISNGTIKKNKPLLEIEADEIPFDIPDNWKWVRLGDLTQKITSGNTPAGGKNSNAYVKEGYCFFREQNIYNDGIHMDGMVYISEDLLKRRTNSTVLPKDILLNITGGSIGRCTLIPDDFSKGSINQHILIVRLLDEEMRQYIHLLLCSPYGQRYIKRKSVGDKDGFSGGRCKNMPIPLPPLSEQKRVVETINCTYSY